LMLREKRKSVRSQRRTPSALNYSQCSDNADCIALYFSERIAVLASTRSYM
jgi:hypothetical protein